MNPVPWSVRSIRRQFGVAGAAMRRHRQAVLCSLTALTFATALGAWHGCVVRPNRPEVADLVAALLVQGSRPVDGRLSGFPYLAAPSPTRGTEPGSPSSADVRLRAARLLQTPSAGESPQRTAAAGIAYAVIGNWDRSVEALEDAIQSDSHSAVYLNDLAVSYLARAAQQGRAEDLPRALAMAERALKASPSAIEPYFNRALALEMLHIRDAAEQAWREYAARETDARWRHEAQERAKSLRVPVPDAWESVQDKVLRDLANPMTRASTEADLHAHFARPVRETVENVLLPQWADDRLAGRMADAAARLSVARTLAQSLARAGGDPMDAESISVIDKATARGDARALTRLAEGHRTYARGNRIYLENRIRTAVAEFGPAFAVFRAEGSPLALWAQAYGALKLRADGEPQKALRLLQSGDLSRRRARYAVLDGRVAWFEGLIAGELGRADDAAGHFRRARELFRAVGEYAYAADTEGLTADQVSYLGQPAEAWSLNLSAIDHSWRAKGTHSRYAMTSSTFLALASGLPEAALHFQDAVVRTVASTQQVARPEAYLFRARVRALLGMESAAWADIQEAEKALALVEDPGMKQRVQAELSWVRAEADAALGSRRYPDAAADALQFFRRGQFPLETVRVLRTRAKLHLAASDVAAAETDLRSAIEEFEKQRSSMKDERLRLSFFEEGPLAFEDMVRLQTLQRGQWRTGFEYAERGRGASFRTGEGPPALDGTGAPALTQLQLPANVVLLYFIALDERLIVYTIANGQMTWATRPIRRDALAVQARRLRALAAADDMTRLRPLLRQLYDDVVGPVASALAPDTVVAVVPDGPLNDLPFGALMQPSGRYLLEDHAVVRAPSLAALRRATDAWTSHRTPLRRVLIVAPSATTDGSRPVAPLPDARAEATAIAREYSAATVLTDERATRRSFESLAGDAEIIHFAGHAVANLRYPMLSRLLFTSTGDADDALTSFDLERMAFTQARVVTLAACEAAGGVVVRGEGTLSLARPWLRAGAASVVASIWEIEDKGARDLFRSLHALIAAGVHPARALQRVQLAAAQGGRTNFRDWAGLAVFGATPP